MEIKNKIFTLLLIAGYLVPLLVCSVGTLWIGISVLSGLLLISKRKFLRIENMKIFLEQQFFSDDGFISCNKRHATWILVLLQIVAIGLGAMQYYGYTNNSVTIGGLTILPTWLLLVYPVIGFYFLQKQRKKFKPIYFLAFIPVIGEFTIQYYQRGLQTASAKEATWELWSSLFVAALCEELYFRSAVYPYATKVFGKIYGCVFSAALFALWHLGLVLPLLSHFSDILFVNLVNIFILGIITAMIYESYGLSCSILFHALNNGMVLYLFDLVRYSMIIR